MSRDEVVALIVAKAREHGIEPWELLGGAIAESNLDPQAWRQGVWPDQSAGLFQQTVAYAEEGDHTESPENVALIKRLYFDPSHACDVAAAAYRRWRFDLGRRPRQDEVAAALSITLSTFKRYRRATRMMWPPI